MRKGFLVTVVYYQKVGNTVQSEWKHLYGVISETEEQEFGPIGIGEHQDRVYTIGYDDLATVVSDSPQIAYDSIPQESVVLYLATHQFVIEQVMKRYAVIPIKFGTMARDKEEVRQILREGYTQFRDALRKMDNKVEIEVVATWNNLDAILKEIGEEDKIGQFRVMAAARPPSELQAAKLELGKMVKSALDDRRANTASEIVDKLSKCAVDYWPHDVMDDNMIMNVAFLILRDKEGELDNAVNELNEKYQEKVDFRCVGPLPPYSFTTMEVKRMDFSEIIEAKNLLVLGEEATKSEIKQKHRELARRFHPDQHPGDIETQKQFERITKAYRLLSDYCQQEKCSFSQEEVDKFLLIRTLEM